MLSRLIRTFLWIFLHVVFTICDKILVLWVYINFKISEIRRIKYTKDSVEYVNFSIRNVMKVPHHLVLIINEERISYEDIARLIIWSLAAGISYFSIYDKKGSLNKNEDRLFGAVQKLKQNVPGHIKWKNQPELNGYQNGTKNKIIINLLTVKDGKEKIASFVKKMCSDVKSEILDPEVINVDYLEKQLSELYLSLPEPNLAIYCGKFCQTNGLLPWHIRLTEFLSLGSHHMVKVENFVNLLCKYGNCEQRFGK